MKVKLFLGDSAVILKSLQDDSIDSIITDPPAGIAFMGKEWDKNKGGRREWIQWLASIFKEGLRVLKPGGHALVWSLPRTSHWTATALEDAGFELRDRITHCFGSGFPKSLDVSKAIDKQAGAVREVVGFKVRPDGSTRPNKANWSAGWSAGAQTYAQDAWTQENMAKGGNNTTAPATPDAQRYEGFGTALKPAVEDYWLARKRLAGTVAANVLEWGCGALNINGSRIPLQGEESPTVQRRKHAAPGISVGASGWKSPARPPSFNAPHPGEQLGRWPANLILSHSPDCSEDTCVEGCPVRILGEQSGERKSGGRIGQTSASALFGQGSNGSSVISPMESSAGTAARYFLNLRPDDPPFFYCPKASKADRNEGLADLINTHPTVKSTRLMAYLCRLITPPKGLILDPFMGSGSTGVAALREGFRFTGIECEEEYFKIAKARLKPKKEIFFPISKPKKSIFL